MPPRRPPARSTFDRHRRWACRANGTAGEERRATDGPDDHGISGQLCGDQHTARLPHTRRLPDHGGGRSRRSHTKPGGTAGLARLRHWGAGVRWSRQLDRSWQFFACADLRAAGRAANIGQLGVGVGHGSARRPSGVVDSLARTVAAPSGAPKPSAVTTALGLLIGLIAMAYQLITGRSFTQVLFSGQDALPNWSSTQPTIRSVY
jgi:hypothetical protein